MADDVQAPDITPDDFDGEQETPKAEPSTAKEEPKADKAEDKKPEAKGKEVETKADDTAVPPDVPTKDEKTDEEKPEPEPPKDEPQDKVANERKAQLNTEIRDLVSQRNALKAEVEKANAEVYQPATEDELTADGMNATDARLEALRQRIEVKDYNDRVADAQLTLSSESERVLTDFPIFNSESDQYDKELAEEAATLLEANLILDPNTNQVIGSNVSPYQLYKTLARASGMSATKGQIKAQAATEKQLANVDAASSAAPPAKPKDPLAELWAEPL